MMNLRNNASQAISTTARTDATMNASRGSERARIFRTSCRDISLAGFRTGQLASHSVDLRHALLVIIQSRDDIGELPCDLGILLEILLIRVGNGSILVLIQIVHCGRGISL